MSAPVFLGGARNVGLVWLEGKPGDGPVCVWAFVRDRRGGGGTFFRSAPFRA